MPVNATYRGHMVWKMWFITTLGLIAVDQLLNWAIRLFWPDAILINHQAFFGLLAQPWAIAGLLFFAAFILWRLRMVVTENRLLAIALALIVAGGLSNVIDRIIYGGVIDYLPVLHWFTFNLADAEISVGTGIFIWKELIGSARPR